MDNNENELILWDCEDEVTYFQYQRQEQAKLLDTDSAAYEELKPILADWNTEKGKDEEDEEEAENKIREYLKKHNEGKENNEYLVRGAELQCSCGSHTRKLNLSPCHGVYIKGHPMVHELDCFPGDKENITWYGVCSKENPNAEKIIVTGQNGQEIHGSKCDPEPVGVWMDSYEGTRIVDSNKMMDDPENPVGCNSLTVGSFLVCRRGGIISPVNSGQDRTVRVEEFKEGWSAYCRVTEFKDEQGDVKEPSEYELQDSTFHPGEKKGFFTSFIPKRVSNMDVFLKWAIMSPYADGIVPSIASYFQRKDNLYELQSGKNLEKGYFTPNKYIDNQNTNSDEWEHVKYGLSNMEKAGCEIMATFNAHLSLGEDMNEEDLANLISYYETHGMTLGGFLGTSPYAILDYFTSRGYETDFTTSLQQEEINRMGDECDTTIITLYNRETDLFGGHVHTVNVEKKEDGTFQVYNSTGIEPQDSLWDVIVHMGRQNDAPICIIGISNPKEDEPDEKVEVE